MLRWVCAVVVAAIVSAFAFLLVTGRYIDEGRVVASVSSSHGLHVGDLYVISFWAVAMLTLGVLVAVPGRGREASSAPPTHSTPG